MSPFSRFHSHLKGQETCYCPDICCTLLLIWTRTCPYVPALWRTALNFVGFAFVFSPRHSLSKLSSAHLA